jgi:DNA-binding winged helix-turn-helix (wHTH) protein
LVEGNHDRGGDVVLIAVSNEGRGARLARAFCDVALPAVLAFDAAQVRSFLASVATSVLVFEDELDPGPTVLDPRASNDVIVLLLGDPLHDAARRVHAVLPRDTPAIEVVLRTQALLELAGPDREPAVHAWGPLTVDVRRRQARWDAAPVSVTPVQFRILLALVKARGAVISKAELQRVAWPYSPPDDGERLVSHVRRIRAKLMAVAPVPFLLTARGEGFRLADPTETEFANASGR